MAVGAFFESAKRGAGGEGRVAVDRRLSEQIMAQGVVIVEVFVALDEAEDALAQELLLGVGDEARVAVIGKDLAQIIDQAKARVDLRTSGGPPSLETSPPSKESSIFLRSKL